MSQPPDDDTWQSVLGELNDALDSLQLRDGPERQSLIEGVKEAMEDIFEIGAEVVVSASVEPSSTVGPSVVVLDGGKEEASSQANDTDKKEAKPSVQFKVVSEPPVADDVGSPLGTTTDIHVYRVDPRMKQPALENSTVPLGVIATRTEKGSPAWQTIYQGQSNESYRIFCEQGVLEVAADQLPHEFIHPRQSIDLQAKRIQVRSSTQDDARGVYCKITG